MLCGVMYRWPLGATGLQSELDKECTVLDSPREIAKGMAAIFNHRKKTDAEGFFTGLASGFMDIPEDMWLLTKNYLDSDNRWRNQTDTIRLLSLLKKGVTSEDMRKVITTVINKYVSGLSEDQCRHLLIKMAGQQLGAIGFKMAFVNQIISLFASQVIPKVSGFCRSDRNIKCRSIRLQINLQILRAQRTGLRCI